MKQIKLQKLKNYSGENVYKKLFSVIENLPDDFLSETLYTKKILQQKAQKIYHCHDKILKSEKISINQDTGEFKKNIELLIGNFCNQFLLCPVCAKKRTEIIYHKYFAGIKKQFNKFKYSYFLTFTIENQNKFSDSWEILTDGLRKFRLMGQRRGRYSGLKSGGESGKIKSAIGCGEIKKGEKSKLWHSHYHFIVFADDKIDYSIYDEKKKKEIIINCNENFFKQPDKNDLSIAIKERIDNIPVSKLSREWYQATDGKGINLSCIPIKNTENEINKTIREIIKYTSKVSDLSRDDMLEVLINKDKKRFLTTWGEIRKDCNLLDDSVIEIDEENLKIDYINTSIVYNIKKSEYNNFDESENEMLNEMVLKKDKMSEFLSKTNKIRSFKINLLFEIKKDMIIKGFENRTARIEAIKNINAIKNAYDFFVEKQFRKIVDIKILRNKKRIFGKLYGLDLYYYKMFEKAFP